MQKPGEGASWLRACLQDLSTPKPCSHPPTPAILCFQVLTNPSPRKLFLFTSIQNAPGCHATTSFCFPCYRESQHMSATRPTLHRERRRSREIFDRAAKLLVGGVNSPVRAFRSVGGDPLIIERGEAQYLYDADGNQLLDYVCSWGAILLGHANPAISAAIADQAKRGTSFGVTTELELELATLITRAIPSIERIRFVSSGTEATMSAVRLARGVTKRDFILKFEGCYHGHADSFLSQAGSGLATLGIAECPGVPQALAELTLNAPYNDLNAVERLFAQHKAKIAAIIVEPIP